MSDADTLETKARELANQLFESVKLLSSQYAIEETMLPILQAALEEQVAAAMAAQRETDANQFPDLPECGLLYPVHIRAKIRNGPLATVEAQKWLDAQAERERELVEALEHISEYWNRRENERAMNDALYHMIDTANAALAAYRRSHGGGQ